MLSPRGFLPSAPIGAASGCSFRYGATCIELNSAKTFNPIWWYRSISLCFSPSDPTPDGVDAKVGGRSPRDPGLLLESRHKCRGLHPWTRLALRRCCNGGCHVCGRSVYGTDRNKTRHALLERGASRATEKVGRIVVRQGHGIGPSISRTPSGFDPPMSANGTASARLVLRGWSAEVIRAKSSLTSGTFSTVGLASTTWGRGRAEMRFGGVDLQPHDGKRIVSLLSAKRQLNSCPDFDL